MSNFLSDGRAALLAALKGDGSIVSLVRTWFEFNRDLIHRFDIKPADCTAYSLHPGRIVEPDDRYNAAYDFGQDIIVIVTTDGMQPDPCEELIALTLARVRAARDNMLGLASEGLKNIVPSATLVPWEQETTARLMWQATITIQLRWIRFT